MARRRWGSPVKQGFRSKRHQLPHVFEPQLYRDATGLQYLSNDEAFQHWKNWGRARGIHGCALTERNAFARMALYDTNSFDVLEISPFTAPLVPGAKTCDVFSTDQLRKRAAELGLNPNDVTNVDFVLSIELGLRSIPRKFANVVSSHVVEHVPDLIGHFDEVSSLLNIGGRYFVLLPDYRFCFDHFIEPTNLTEIMAARLEKRTRHTATSFLEQRTLTTHNDSLRHWNGDFGTYSAGFDSRIQAAISEWNSLSADYLDLHAWQFDPQTFTELISACLVAFNIPLEIEAVYDTRFGSNEFWVVLNRVEDRRTA